MPVNIDEVINILNNTKDDLEFIGDSAYNYKEGIKCQFTFITYIICVRVISRNIAEGVYFSKYYEVPLGLRDSLKLKKVIRALRKEQASKQKLHVEKLLSEKLNQVNRAD